MYVYGLDMCVSVCLCVYGAKFDDMNTENEFDEHKFAFVLLDD